MPPTQIKGASILATNLIKSYCLKEQFKDARRLFDEIPERDVVAWTSMISGYTSGGRNTQAWTMFCDMKKEDVQLNAFTVSSVLKACKGMGVVSCGSMVHGLAVKNGVDGNMYVQNALMDMYATCSAGMSEACMVFEMISVKNDVSWTTMIASYTHKGDGYAALKVFKRMVQEEAELNSYTYSITIRACASIGSYTYGQQIHAAVGKHGFGSDPPVGNSLVDMYCRCGKVSEAYRYFHEMPERDLITWNTMISGFERSGSDGSLQLFSQLSSEVLHPNCFTFTSVVASCANLAVLHCGRQIHAVIVRRGLDGNVALANAFIDMYAKCGSIADSRRIFDEMPSRDVISWTSIMNGYGSHGYADEAIRLFGEMVHCGVKPDQLVFMGLISACSHSGLVDDGLKYFHFMWNNYNIKPNQEIYGCVVDLLGRAGRVTEAYELTVTMPFEPDKLVWGALLGACKAHRNSYIGRLAANKILDLRPNGAETYVMLSNIYASDGRWGEFAEMRKLMRGTCSKKVAGRSWIEVRNQVYNFVVGEKLGPNIELVYEELETLIQHMKEVGYVPDLECCIEDFEAVA
ncbi:hypothetical protein IFM89_001432 [Coptis chinensis]|uniref:Pentatricopeptide repeat-containing protein n=1 Tax=Coptis chinensis TaxID=261450 RepID=A0A835H5P6_9MAGN|nr:hypothetical protein IFM89_001432 [Coptis chinensis]